MHHCAMHLLGNMVGRKLPYPKLLLNWKNRKLDTYYIKEWCEHWKMKTNAMRQLSNLLVENRIFKVEDDIDWAKWHEFVLKYHMNGASMRSLVT